MILINHYTLLKKRVGVLIVAILHKNYAKTKIVKIVLINLLKVMKKHHIGTKQKTAIQHQEMFLKEHIKNIGLNAIIVHTILIKH